MSGKSNLPTTELQEFVDSVPSEDKQMSGESGVEGGRAASCSGVAEVRRAASWPVGAEGGRAASCSGVAEVRRAASWPVGAEGGRAASCEEQQQALSQYTIETLAYINRVRRFCEGFSTWMDAREEELFQMRGIKGRADEDDLCICRAIQLVKKTLWGCVKALWGCVKTPCECMKALCKKEKETKTKLADVLEATLGGLVELHHFLQAVEKLAVTSLHVFMEENQVLHLPGEISLKQVRVVIIAARQICPLLLEFKRDASDFFLPKLQNVDVLSYQLYRYIKTTRKICEKLEKSLYVQSPTTEPVVDPHVSEEGVPERLCDINLLNKIRMGEHFRTVFLFKAKSCSDFSNKFSDCEPGMLKSLEHLERAADKLDFVDKGAKIFSVLSSLVGIIGGVLSVVGLALIPATAGVSLIKSGACLGISSICIIVLTFIIEGCFKCYQKNKANKHLKSFMTDMQRLRDCLEEETSHPPTQIQEYEINAIMGVGKVFGKVQALVKFIDLLADIVGATDIPEIYQTAVKGFLTRLSLIAPNVLSIFMDVFYFGKQFCSLVKCNKTEVSQFFRARAAILRSQMDSWKKIHDSLCEGQSISEEHRAVLDLLFNQGVQ